jgi:hypothetical protein
MFNRLNNDGRACQVKKFDTVINYGRPRQWGVAWYYSPSIAMSSFVCPHGFVALWQR